MLLDAHGNEIGKKPLKVKREAVKPERPTEQNEIHDYLLAHGFADLNDPALIHQLAFHVQDHQHFKELILATKSEERNNCYEAMCPYLRFKAKPFYEYLLI